MIIISKNAQNQLHHIFKVNLRFSSEYGSPPIFYWFCRIIAETQNIDNCNYLRRGREYTYRLGLSLGVAHFYCEFVGKKRIIIITDYDINMSMLFAWKNSTDKGGLIPKDKKKSTPKTYRLLTTKPLFGYRFVMNNKKEYNLIDQNGKLITQWFRNIKRLQKPYGEYQIIAYINVRGQLCGLGYDGKVYNINKLWKDAYLSECINFIINRALYEIQKQNLNESKDGVIRLNESQMYSIIKEIVQYLVA